MKLTVLGSSSSGNCYLLENDRECLVVECGLPFRLVKEALGFNILKIVGVVCSHVHSDHFGYAEEYLKCGIPVYASEETHRSISRKYDNQIAVKCGYWYQIGGFNITPFRAEHDVECFGYLIRCEDMTILFATDTCFIRDNFKKLNINHLIIECNYDEKIINENAGNGVIDISRRNRTMKTHMSLDTCKSFILANKTPSLRTVTLIHMSDANVNEKDAVKEVNEIAGCEVCSANVGTVINYDLCPF